MLARGNFAREVVLPDMIDFVDPNLLPDAQTRQVNRRILSGMDITLATSEREPGGQAEANMDKNMAGAKAAPLPRCLLLSARQRRVPRQIAP